LYKCFYPSIAKQIVVVILSRKTLDEHSMFIYLAKTTQNISGKHYNGKQMIEAIPPSSIVPQDSKMVAKQHRPAYLGIGSALIYELWSHVCGQSRAFTAASS
jgi:hypothetical protein